MPKEERQDSAIIAEVAVPGVAKILHYSIPETMLMDAVPGVRIAVPLAQRTVTAYLVARCQESEHPRLKPLLDIIDAAPILSGEMLKLTEWASRYYVAPWGTLIRSALPAGIDTARSYRVSLTRTGTEVKAPGPLFESIRQLLRSRELSIRQLQGKLQNRHIKAAVERHAKAGLLRIREVVRDPIRTRRETRYRVADGAHRDGSRLTQLKRQAPAQAAVLEHFLGDPVAQTAAAIVERTGVSPGVLRALVGKGLLTTETVQIVRDPFAGDPLNPAPAPALTKEQQSAAASITPAVRANRFETFLLHGVTGSGKTEVYLQVIAAALSRGRDALLIVPEIGLTPQLVRLLRSRFGPQVAVLHSGLSDGERYDQWNRLRRGEASVAVGARSAIFAPLPGLGVIVVDEEHDGTYKQGESPRYHARDLAVVRGRLCRAVVILGSATPSVESFFNARTGKYRLLTLTKRIDDRPLPDVCVVDMKTERGAPVLSNRLNLAVQEGLAHQEQILLFLNRRGYAPYMICTTCGFVVKCPNCSVSLTYHLKENALACHHCDHAVPLRKSCPECQEASLELQGMGTERIEEELADIFKGSVLLRLDRDTTRRKGSGQRILDRFRRRDGDILVGTQMVTKGHHLPGISTVGVLNADASLHLPDFRSGERTFQMLTQVAGRAGRGETRGRVFLQSFTPEHYSVQAATRHDYERFFEAEISLRQAMHYPPYRRLINLILASNSLNKAAAAAERLARILANRRAECADVEILGPARAPLSTLRGKKRYQILIKGKHAGVLNRIVREGQAEFARARGFSGVDLTVDVDPVDFL
jgi:primosomal protein N' (replication factor Y)